MTGNWRGEPDGPELILGYGNIAGVGFADRVAAAATAGFASIGYSIIEHEAVQRDGVTVDELVDIACRSGVRVAELEIGLGFDGGYDQPGAPPPPRWGPSSFPWDVPYLTRETEEQILELGAAFGSRHIVVAGSWGGSRAQAAERFGSLCDRAAEVGLKVAIEFMPGTSMPDVGSALQVVLDADRPNGGLCVDNWHYERGRRDPEALQSLPADSVIVIQLSDGPTEVLTDVYFDETINHRQLFGDGEWDVSGFLDTLWRNGVTAPISIEVLSSEWRGRPADEIAASFMAATRRLVRTSR